MVIWSCLLVVCGLFLVVFGSLWLFAGGLWLFVLVFGGLWLFLIVGGCCLFQLTMICEYKLFFLNYFWTTASRIQQVSIWCFYLKEHIVTWLKSGFNAIYRSFSNFLLILLVFPFIYIFWYYIILFFIFTFIHFHIFTLFNWISDKIITLVYCENSYHWKI